MPDDIFEKYNKRGEFPEKIPAPETEAQAEAPVLEPLERTEKSEEKLKGEIAALKEKIGEVQPQEQGLAGREKALAENMVQKLVKLAKERGEQAALSEAESMHPYILDRLHDELAKARKL